MELYSIVGRIGEGAHGIVLKAKQKTTENIVALKKIPLKNIEDGIPCMTLREIKALELMNHENIVKLFDVFSHGAGVVLVFEYMPTDLSVLLRNTENPLTDSQIKAYLIMLLKGVAYCHSLGIMHRDLKPANLLISSSGHLKIADFGQADLFGKEGRSVSHQVATRWYRAPELLYGSRSYDEGVDLWAVGCIFGEMLNKFPLFRILPNIFHGAFGQTFRFMDDNPPCHCIGVVQDCLNGEDIQHLIWPSRSPDLNPIENVWDILGRCIAAHQCPPSN